MNGRTVSMIAGAALAVLIAAGIYTRVERKEPAATALLGSVKTAQPPTKDLIAALAPFNGNVCYSGSDPAPGRFTTITVATCPPLPPDTCPAGRITSMWLAVGSYTGGGRKIMDVTQADNLFGYYAWAGARLSYPWKNEYTVFEFPRATGAYIAAKFTVPTTTPANQWGVFGNLETLPGPGIDVAISDRCGDFTPSALYCSADDVFGGRPILKDKLPGYPGVALCSLSPGATYYVNIRLDDPVAGGANCAGNVCKFGIQRNHTP